MTRVLNQTFDSFSSRIGQTGAMEVQAPAFTFITYATSASVGVSSTSQAELVGVEVLDFDSKDRWKVSVRQVD